MNYYGDSELGTLNFPDSMRNILANRTLRNSRIKDKVQH
jgi:hypothetical protein